MLATSLGAIYFVLRNGADQELASSPPVGLTQLAGAPAPSLNLAAAAPTNKLQHPSPRPYEVETILGDKQVINGFR